MKFTIAPLVASSFAFFIGLNMVNANDTEFPLITKEIQNRILLGAVDKNGNHVFMDKNGKLDLHPGENNYLRRLPGGSKKGQLVDGECSFIFHLYDSYDTTQIQVDNGAILAYDQIINDDDDYISICDDRKCFGDSVELTFIACGDCGKDEDVIEFTICEETVLDRRSESDTYISCPDITDLASASCEGFNIGDGAELINPNVRIIAEGSVVKISPRNSNICYRCEVTCEPRD